MRFVGIIVILFLFGSIYAQRSESVFELYKKDASLSLELNNRFTHIHNQFGTIYGFKVGLNFDKKLKNTFSLSSTIIPLGKPTNSVDNFRTAQLHFISIAEEYTFYQKNKWGYLTYFTAGYGINESTKQANNGILLQTVRNNIIPLEFGLQCSYLWLDWFELKGGGGWRQFVIGNEMGLSGYYFKIGAGIKYKAFKERFRLGSN